MRDKPTPNYYANITATVRYDKRLSANQKLLYAEITALTNKEGYCWASNSYFAELYGVDARTVRRWIQALAKQGYIHVTIEYVRNSKQVDRRIIRIADTYKFDSS